MADLYNEKTGVIEKNIPSEEVDKRILTGGYSFVGDTDSGVYIGTNSGKAMRVSPNLAADYIRAGSARYLKPHVAQGMMENEEFPGSLMGQLAAIPYGMEDYLGAGIFSSIGESLGVAPGLKEAVQSQNPWTWHTSGIVPSAVAAFLSGGITGAGQLGAHGLKQGTKAAIKEAAKKEVLEESGKSFAAKGIDAGKTFLRDYTLPGIGGKVAAKVQDKVYDGLMQHGNKFVPATIGNAKLAQAVGPHAAKIISGGLAASVEGGIWGAGEGVSEAMLGEPGEAAEHIFNSIGTNMLIGLGVGGAVSSAIPLLTGAAGVGAKSLSKIIDFNSFVGGKALKNSEAYIRAVAKRNNMPEAQIERMLETFRENGPEVMREMTELHRNLNKHAGATRELVDSLLLLDDFVHLTDVNGFSRDTLIDLIRATRSGHEIDFSISRFEAEPRVVKLKKEIEELEIKTEGQEVIPGLVDELSAKKTALKDYRASYLHENQLFNYTPGKPSLFENPMLALDEARKGIDIAMSGLDRMLRQFPELAPTGTIQAIQNSLREREASWYRALVSEEIEEAVITQHRLNNPRPKPLSDAEYRVFNLWESYWAEFNDAFLVAGQTASDRGLFRKIAPILKKIGVNPDDVITELKRKKGTLKEADAPSELDDIGIETWDDLGDFPEEKLKGETLIELANEFAAMAGRPIDFSKVLKEIQEASAIAADTGDATQLFDAYKRYGVKIPKPKGITQKRYNSLKQRNTPWGGEAEENFYRREFSKLREQLSGKNPLERDISIIGEPQYAALGPATVRDKVRSFIAQLNERTDAVELPDAIFADAYKTLEDTQTAILKNIQYGLLPSGGNIESDLTQNVIDVLRKMMEDESKWGLMATQKKRFNELSVEFKAKRGQVLTDLTEKDGTDQVASAGKILTFFNKLDSETSAIAKSHLSGYVSEGQALLEFIRSNFEPVDFADLIKTHPGAARALQKRLDHVNIQAALKSRGRPVTPRQPDFPEMEQTPRMINQEWDNRMVELGHFVEGAHIDLNQSFNYIQNELPLAKALTSEGARQLNLNNTMSDLGRGGAASAFAYLATGSPVASALVGLGIGSVSMAMDPVRLMAFVNQLRIARDASQDVIGEYLEDWLTKKLPKSAIHKSWEKNARQMLLIGSQASRRDIKETKSDVRKRMAKSRASEAWSERVQASLDGTITEDNYFEASKAFSELVSNPSVMNRFLEDSTKVFENTPDLRQAMKESLQTRLQYAHRIMPQATGGFLNKPIPPTRIQLDKWGTALRVLNSPTDTLLTALMTGSITEDMVDALREGWPKIHADLSQKVLELVTTPGRLDEITTEQKNSISILLGIPSINPSEIAQLNKAWARDNQQGQSQSGPGIREIPQQFSGDMTSTVERPRI